jgi:hypothetical protein
MMSDLVPTIIASALKASAADANVINGNGSGSSPSGLTKGVAYARRASMGTMAILCSVLTVVGGLLGVIVLMQKSRWAPGSMIVYSLCFSCAATTAYLWIKM